MVQAAGRLAALEKEVHRGCFMILLRTSTHRESKEHFITPSVFGEIVYENWLFDIPMMLDIAAVYGRANRDLAAKMLANLFKQQPSYNEDLDTAVRTIATIFTRVIDHCTASAGTETPDGMIEYATDIAVSLHALLELRPEVAVACRRHSLLSKLAELHDALMAFIGPRPPGSVRVEVREWITVLAHALFSHGYCNKMVPPPPADETGVLEVLDAMLQHPTFAADWSNLRPVHALFRKLETTDPSVDKMRLDYFRTVIDAYHTVPTESAAGPAALPVVHSGGAAGVAAAAGAPATPATTSIELQSQISAVRDLFPDLGEGFVAACLEAVGNNLEDFTNRILEDTLPPSVAKLSRDMPLGEWEARQPAAAALSVQAAPFRPSAAAAGGAAAAPAPAVASSSSAVQSRTNIFDNDEFDIFGRPGAIDLSKVSVGKKGQGNLESFLDDKTFVATRLDNYLDSQYEYEDEYDDTYDDMGGAGPTDARTEDGLPPLEPNLNRGAKSKKGGGWKATAADEDDGGIDDGGDAQEGSADDDDDGDAGEAPPRPRGFGPDAPRGGRGRARGGAGRGGGAGGRGGAAGGQDRPKVDLSKRDDKSLRARAKNEKNKAVRGNHNRAKGAAKKRNAGMV